MEKGHDSCFVIHSSASALALLVLGILAADADRNFAVAATATEDVAILAHAFDRGADFHGLAGRRGLGSIGVDRNVRESERDATFL